MLAACLTGARAPQTTLQASLSSTRRPSPLPVCRTRALPTFRRPAGGRGAAQKIAAVAAPSAPPQRAQQAQTAGRNGHALPLESPGDIVIVGSCRTPSTRARKGGLKDTPPDDLVVTVLQETLKRSGIKPEEVGDVCFGSVFPPSSKRANEVRTALLLAGFPTAVPAYTVNRQCAAGLQAIANVAAAIRAGFYEIGIAGGVEHLTKDPLDWQGSDNPRIQESPDAKDVGLTLGLTAENVAERYQVPRQMQDHFAAASHAKAAAAQAAGKFKDEIVAVLATSKDPSTGELKSVSIDADDGIRPESTEGKLGQLKPYFKKDGSVTVGNACQNTDCAAAMVLMRRSEAERRGLPIQATLRSFATVGVHPAIMGTAPSVAIPKALERAGLSKDDIDVFELNEAFASQAAFCVRELGLPEEKVNPNGGAIALGHPAGATGARQTVTLLHELARRLHGSSIGSASGRASGSAAGSGSVSESVGGSAGGSTEGSASVSASGSTDTETQPSRRFGVVSMCTGSGMGAAAVFESSSSSGSMGSSTASIGSTASVEM